MPTRIRSLVLRTTALLLGVLACAFDAHAQTLLPPSAQLIASASAASTTTSTFDVTTAQNLTVTLTDLGVPAPLTQATIAVTQGNQLVGSATLPTTASSTTAQVVISQASGTYTIFVFGTPASTGTVTGVGSFSVCTAPTGTPTACIAGNGSFNGTINAAPSSGTGPSTYSTTLNIATAGSYVVNFIDFAFPKALSTPPNLALFQGSNVVQVGIANGTALTLAAGSYTLLAVAQADSTAQAGLYGITIQGPGGAEPLNTAIQVGTLTPATSVTNPQAQSLTLTVNDYAFPAGLQQASAVLANGGQLLGTVSASSGATNSTPIAAAPSGTLQLWTYGAPASSTSTGTFGASVDSTTGNVFAGAWAANTATSTTFAYAYVTSPVTAGAYQATITDLGFPATLNGLTLAVAQGGALLKQSTTPGTPMSFSASAAGPLVVLASAAPPIVSGSCTPTPSCQTGAGLFDVNVQSTTPSVVFDQTQPVTNNPNAFSSRAPLVGVNGSFNVSLTDLQVPAAFTNLALVVSQGGTVAGKIFNSGTFPLTTVAGENYIITVIATPGGNQPYGLYGIAAVATPPTVTLSANPTSAAVGSTIQLTWTATNATSCVASGGWSGNVAASGGTQSVSLTQTTTYTLTCSGAGGNQAQSVTVTATSGGGGGNTSHGGGGGSIDECLIALLAGLCAMRWSRRAHL